MVYKGRSAYHYDADLKKKTKKAERTIAGVRLKSWEITYWEWLLFVNSCGYEEKWMLRRMYTMIYLKHYCRRKISFKFIKPK